MIGHILAQEHARSASLSIAIIDYPLCQYNINLITFCQINIRMTLHIVIIISGIFSVQNCGASHLELIQRTVYSFVRDR